MPALLYWLGTFLTTVIIKYFSIFARTTAWNILLATGMVVLVGVAISTLLSVGANYVANVLSSMPVFPVVPYFLPSNLNLCLTAYFTVQVAGTVFNRTISFIENKTYILKA